MSKVSIVMSTYNRAHLVGEAIRSALAQTYTDFELIVVDDGSKDDTRDVVAGFADPRIRYVYKKNAGLAAGRNTGIEYACGDYIAFLDDDDLYLPNKLAVQVAFMDQYPEIGWTSGGYRITDMQGKFLGEQRPWLHYPKLELRIWLFWCPTCPTAVMVRREWLDRGGGFDSQQGLQEDWELWLRLAYAGCQMVWVPEIVCVYRLHSANMVRNSKAVRAKTGILRVLDKFFAQKGLASDLRQLHDAAYAHTLLKRATASFRDGDVDAAVQDVRRALELDSTLAADNGQRALDMLLGYASSPLVGAPLAYARTVLAHLPEQPFAVATRRRKLLGQVAADMFFSAAEREDWPRVRRAFVKIIQYDPRWLRNLGVWSRLGDTVVGPTLMDWLRTCYRVVRMLRDSSRE